ncbi:hypothetical protein [Streptosporangium sandarakinum]|uniref:hypothetical protein n=1 Tax=Streptosporangium sandarakinum TaxID=1260955 RepID=UPI0036AEC1A2
MTRRIWTAGEANLGFSEPFWGLLQEVSEQWRERLDLLPWQVTFADGLPTACTLARWHDEVVGEVLAAIALRPGGESEVDWGVVADAERQWVAHAVPPWVMLGFAGEGFCDPSGALLSEHPSTLPIEPTDRRSSELVEAMVTGFNSPARTTGLLVVTVDSRKTAERIDQIMAVHWPGVLTVAFISESGRAALNALLPDRQVPASGARFYPAVDDGLADVKLTRSTLRDRPEVLTALLKKTMHARGARTPTGMASAAAVLLQRVHHPESPTEDTAPLTALPQTPSAQEQLAAALEQVAAAEAAAESADRQRRIVEEELHHLKTLSSDQQPGVRVLQQQLAEVSAERDPLESLLEQAESERDEAVHQRGVLMLRSQQTPSWQDLEQESVADTFPELLAEVAQRYELLRVVADPAAAGALDAYPKAQAWRQKAFDAITTMHAYAQAKQQARADGRPPGPHLADLLAFARSGVPGVMISANIIALTESAQVMNTDRYRRARTFAVRPQTASSGRAVFAAHIKLDGAKAPAPRLHFFDDTDNTGLVYVGWLGPHLITSRTD